MWTGWGGIPRRGAARKTIVSAGCESVSLCWAGWGKNNLPMNGEAGQLARSSSTVFLARSSECEENMNHPLTVH